jgi:hypothetical protein
MLLGPVRVKPAAARAAGPELAPSVRIQLEAGAEATCLKGFCRRPGETGSIQRVTLRALGRARGEERQRLMPVLREGLHCPSSAVFALYVGNLEVLHGVQLRIDLPLRAPLVLSGHGSTRLTRVIIPSVGNVGPLVTLRRCSGGSFLCRRISDRFEPVRTV